MKFYILNICDKMNILIVTITCMNSNHLLIQWNLSKPILIRTKEKYQFRQVIGLDRLTFTALGNIIYKKIEITTLRKAS